uniref:SWIM-type domain-containing protein n=1 Tax=Parascaris univalens TaxID=6257 RepID=A0A915AFP8_PARUN
MESSTSSFLPRERIHFLSRASTSSNQSTSNGLPVTVGLTNLGATYTCKCEYNALYLNGLKKKRCEHNGATKTDES